MGHNPDDDRIRQKAHDLWEAEGHPHGRDQAHWDQAREIIALEDSQKSLLLPRDTGVEEPVEFRQVADNYGDMPNLTDQGEHPLTDITREPAVTQPIPARAAPAPAAKPRKTTAKPTAPAQPDAIVPKPAMPAARTVPPASIAAAKAPNRKAPTTGKLS